MRRLILSLVLLGIILFSTNAQSLVGGFLKPVTAGSLKAANGDRDLISATWKLRLDAALIGTASYFKLDEAGKVTGLDSPIPFAKMGIGPVFTRFDTDASRTWAAGAMLTIPTGDKTHYGVAAVGSYSVFKLGLNYDFGLPFKQGFCILTGLSIDLFNVVQ